MADSIITPSLPAAESSPISKLPLELYFKIVAEFQNVIPRPKIENLRSEDRFKSFSDYRYLGPDLEALRNLRLVSRAFNHVASFALYKHQSLSFRLAGQLDSTTNANDLASTFVQGTSCIPAAAIRGISLRYFGVRGPSRSSSFVSHEWFTLNPEKVPVTYLPEESRSARLLFEARLPRLIHVLKHLEAFDVHFPHVVPIYTGDDIENDPGHYEIPQVNIDDATRSVESICEVFKASNYLTNLADLRLAMLCTHDFVLLNAAIPEQLALQLRRLYLQVCDQSGTERAQLDMPPGMSDRLMGVVPPSNLLVEYPNSQYASAMFELIGRCKNLEALGISGYSNLDCSLLNWRPGNRGRLQRLDLFRLRLTFSALESLLAPTGNTADGLPSNIQTVCLTQVELWDASWADIFRHLSATCPNLHRLYVYDLGYHPSGTSKQWFHDEDDSDIFPQLRTSNPADVSSYQQILLTVMARLYNSGDYKTGLGLFFKDWYDGDHFAFFGQLNDKFWNQSVQMRLLPDDTT